MLIGGGDVFNRFSGSNGSEEFVNRDEIRAEDLGQLSAGRPAH